MYDDSWLQLAEAGQTPKAIAAVLGITPKALVAFNKDKFPTLL